MVAALLKAGVTAAKAIKGAKAAKAAKTATDAAKSGPTFQRTYETGAKAGVTETVAKAPRAATKAADKPKEMARAYKAAGYLFDRSTRKGAKYRYGGVAHSNGHSTPTMVNKKTGAEVAFKQTPGRVAASKATSKQTRKAK